MSGIPRYQRLNASAYGHLSKRQVIQVRDINACKEIGKGGRSDAALLDKPGLRKIGIHHLQVESPTYMWLLMQQRMLDEIFANYSSVYIGGAITPGASIAFSLADHPHARLLAVARHSNGFLFTRQKLVYGLSAES